MDNDRVQQYQRDIDLNIQQLDSEDADERREAASWLGEAAADAAIPRLVDLYNNDPDKRVRQAAAYALGQFRAIDEALKRGEDERVNTLLEKIAYRGELGKRSSSGGLVTLAVLLLVTLALLGAGAVFLPDQLPGLLNRSGVQVASGDPARRAALTGELLGLYTRVRDDSANLRAQYEGVLTGAPLNCTAFFNDPAPILISADDAAAFPDLAQIGASLNGARTSLLSAKAPYYDEICFRSGTPPEGADLNALLATLTRASEVLGTVETSLSELSVTPTPDAEIEPTAAPVSEAATAEPTAEVTEAADPLRHLPALFTIIDEMRGATSPPSLLERYWRDIQQNGRTDGCNQPMPTNIPPNYELPPLDAAASAELARAVDLMNAGLTATRDGWASFILACNANSIGTEVSTRLPLAQAASRSFEAADGILQALRAGT